VVARWLNIATNGHSTGMAAIGRLGTYGGWVGGGCGVVRSKKGVTEEGFRLRSVTPLPVPAGSARAWFDR
jgi:hypothetical protein